MTPATLIPSEADERHAMGTIPESKFEKKRLNTLYRQSYVALPGNLLVALCVAVLFRSHISSPFLSIWLTTMSIVLIVRYFLFKKYKSLKNRPDNPGPWFMAYGVTAMGTGALWGAFGIYANYHVSLVYLSIALLVLAGLAAASIATNAVSMPIFIGFTYPMLLPTGIFISVSGGLEHAILGILVFGFLILTTQSAFQLNRVILKSITHRYEKLQLLDDLQNEKSQVMGLNEQLAHDIERRKQTEKEKEHLIGELQNALQEVKTLSGLIPICAQCKKVRDDKGYWSQIESYLHQHSNADFSHSICPDCATELYPDMDLYGKKKADHDP